MVTQSTAKKATRKTPLRQLLKKSPKVFASERMSPVDRAWLRMDSSANLMMILGVWIIKPGVSFDAVTKRLEERLLQYPRFGQRVEVDALGARWVQDEDFRIERQVVLEHLPKVAKHLEQQASSDQPPVDGFAVGGAKVK